MCHAHACKLPRGGRILFILISDMIDLLQFVPEMCYLLKFLEVN